MDENHKPFHGGRGNEASFLVAVRRMRKALLSLPAVGALYTSMEKAALKGMEAWRGFRTDPADYPFFRLQLLLRKHEPETVAYIRSVLQRGDAAVDVGAHVGYYARLFADLVGDEGVVLALEPNPSNFALLEANLSRYPNARLLQIAVAPQEGQVELEVPERATGWGRIRLGTAAPSWEEDPRLQRAGGSLKRYQVPARPLESLLEEMGLAGKPINLLKIDTEGAEGVVLDSLGRRGSSVLRVLCELGPSNLKAFGHSPLDLVDRLEAMGFTRFKVFDPVAGDGYPHPLPGAEGSWLAPEALRNLLRRWDLAVEGLVMNLVAERGEASKPAASPR